MKHTGVASWFVRLCNAQNDFVASDRIVWVDIEGVPLHAWSHATFHKIGSQWGEVMELEDGNEDLFARKLCIKTKHANNILDSFKIIVKGKVFQIRAKELFVWSPSFKEVPEVVHCSDDESVKNEAELMLCDNTVKTKEKREVSKDPFNIYDLLNRHKKEVGNSGMESSIPYPPGFTPEKVNVTFEQDAPGVQDLQREMYSVSGTYKGGRAYIKIFFDEMIKEVKLWALPWMDAPRIWRRSLDRMEWNGECMVMGDFNEVRCKEDRWGSTFLAQGACSFNSFISNAGLNEVQLEGYSFTWAHPSASKMSKLDRFLVTDGFLSLFPHISAVCLDRHLSDHRPSVTLGRCYVDFGASLISVYTILALYSVSIKMIPSTWNFFYSCDKARMIRFKKKLQLLKKEIQRANLSVKGIMIEGEWVDDPIRVKDEFRNHFADRFNDPGTRHGRINFSFPNRLTFEQVSDLEASVSDEEIRKAVWGCGENKSPGGCLDFWILSKVLDSVGQIFV
ncbi:RNA-directed DNA polymerase, eukaryota [Tanacetum coccineum]